MPATIFAKLTPATASGYVVEAGLVVEAWESSFSNQVGILVGGSRCWLTEDDRPGTFLHLQVASRPPPYTLLQPDVPLGSSVRMRVAVDRTTGGIACRVGAVQTGDMFALPPGPFGLFTNGDVVRVTYVVYYAVEP